MSKLTVYHYLYQPHAKAEEHLEAMQALCARAVSTEASVIATLLETESKTRALRSTVKQLGYALPMEGRQDRPAKRLVTDTSALCTYCNQFLPIDAFYKNVARPDGIEYYCKSCYNKPLSDKPRVIEERRGRPATRRVTATHAECSSCGEMVYFGGYRKNKQKPDGIEYSCKECKPLKGRVTKTPPQRASTEIAGQDPDAIIAAGFDDYRGPAEYTGPNTLRCSTCRLPKPKESFAIDNTRPRRYAYNCKACNREKHLERK